MKHKRQYTRKQVALRRWLVVLLLLALSCAGLVVNLTPNQALRDMERGHALGKTDILERRNVGPFRFCLSQNERVLFLSSQEFRFLYGWLDSAYLPLDLTKESGPVDAMQFSASHHDSDRRYHMIVGTTSLETAVTARVHGCEAYIEGSDYQSTEDQWTGEILEKDGVRYFWFGQELSPPIRNMQFSTLELLDTEGNILCTFDISPYYGGFSKL